MWLESGVGIVPDPQNGGHIAVWQDQSGKGNDAHSYLATPLVDPAAIKGHDAVLCDTNGSFQVADAPSLQFGTGDFAIVMVAKLQLQTKSNPATVWAKDPNANGVSLLIPPATTQNASSTLSLSAAQTSITTSFLSRLGEFSVVVARGQTLGLDIANYTSSGPANATDVSAAGTPVVMCLGQTGSLALELAEVIVVKGAFSAADEANVRAYFSAKFAL